MRASVDLDVGNGADDFSGLIANFEVGARGRVAFECLVSFLSIGQFENKVPGFGFNGSAHRGQEIRSRGLGPRAAVFTAIGLYGEVIGGFAIPVAFQCKSLSGADANTL